ncbi:MAG: dienelactone hydrolase family protein [Smithellaceae bacterium]|nr:dienelactone hydrolase family protein [Syntrophaceae bacterium]MDD4241208.1 dienelactone hydrolase family protein [Smithellaceae bacterium]NLX53397.1 hypothetical protein [Deltaproteobacteria bacterium]
MTQTSTPLNLLILTLCFLAVSCAGPGIYEPPSGRGPLVVMISGKTGTALYGKFAGRLAEAGYRVALYDGNDFPLSRPQACRSMLRKIVADHRPLGAGKSAVIGYSLGGAVALSCAASEADLIAGIIAYYPATALLPDPSSCVDAWNVPIVVLQGEEDRYFNCCRVETIRAMQKEARKKGRAVELHVYPGAGHGFNLGPAADEALESDAWQKTMDALKKFLR